MMPGSENPHIKGKIPGSAGMVWLLFLPLRGAVWLCADVFASREASACRSPSAFLHPLLSCQLLLTHTLGGLELLI